MIDINRQEKVLRIMSAILESDTENLLEHGFDGCEKFDSMAMVNIVAALESEFDLFIDTEDVEGFSSPMHVVEYIDRA